MSEPASLPEQRHRKRPVLLTVLCALSFAYGVVILLNGFINAFTELPERNMDLVKAEHAARLDEAASADPTDQLTRTLLRKGIALDESIVQQSRTLGHYWIAIAVASLTGVTLMWMLRRIGFWLYAIASTASVLVKFIYFGGDNLLASVISYVSVVFAVVFLLLYASQLKHMR